MVYKFLDKKTSGSGIKYDNISNKELAEELHKPITRRFKKAKVHSFFIDNIWGADLADMQLIRKFNKGIRFLLYVTDIYSKYAWVIPFKDKRYYNCKCFSESLKESDHSPNKIWVDKGREFYDSSMKSWLRKMI